MNRIEDIDFQNIEFIQRYINEEMSREELVDFKKRLKKDKSLMEDFLFIKKHYGVQYRLEDKLNVRYRIAKKVLSNVVPIILLSSIMLAVSILVLYLLSIA